MYESGPLVLLLGFFIRYSENPFVVWFQAIKDAPQPPFHNFYLVLVEIFQIMSFER
jgi:hypothetical protein